MGIYTHTCIYIHSSKTKRCQAQKTFCLKRDFCNSGFMDVTVSLDSWGTAVSLNSWGLLEPWIRAMARWTLELFPYATVAAQCPHNARTVPAQCPHSARTVPACILQGFLKAYRSFQNTLSYHLQNSFWSVAHKRKLL